MPPNLLKDEKVKKLAEVLSNELQTISVYAYKLNFNNIDELPEPIVDHLLWENHIMPDEGLNLAETLEEKRELLKSAVELHRKKGTPYAIEKVLEAVNLKGEVVEWKEYDSDPYHFIVELQPTKKIKNIDDVRRMVLAYKNKRSWFDGFVILYEGEIIVVDDSYFYFVYYPTTGLFSGKKENAQLTIGNIGIFNDTYDYKVEYPTSEKLVTTVEGESAEIANDTYTYPKHFYAAGELETLDKGSSIQLSSSVVYQDNYNYRKTLPVCGEFYAEAE